MKSTLRLTSTTFAVAMLTEVVQAQLYTNDCGIWYYTTTNCTITIEGYTGPGGAVTIPDTINGLPVTMIGDRTFQSCTSLTAITLPDSVICIANGGLYQQEPGDLRHPFGTFACCTQLKSVKLSVSLTSIGDFAFLGCGLTNITIYNNLTNIGSGAFSACTSLINLTLPDSLTTIESRAFDGCTSLSNLALPDSLTTIESGAFNGCTSLIAFEVTPKSPSYSSLEGVLFDKSQGTLVAYPNAKSGLSYTVPDTVRSIGDSAFYECASLTNVALPNSITTIGDFAFYTCTSLTSITIPNSVTTIGDWAFANCTKASLTIPPNVTSIGDSAYANCSLSNVTIPSSVTNVGSAAFFSCSFLTNVNILGNIATWGIGTVEIPPKAHPVGSFAFGYCDSLKTVAIAGNVQSIPAWMFYACPNLTSVSMPNSITNIGDSAFIGCRALTSINFKGNAPNVNGLVLDGDDKATVYYLPGTTGWSAHFAGLPTAPWVLPYPVILTLAPNFGIQANQFRFRISWATNASVAVEASTNLANPVWVPLSTNVLVNGWTDFSDPQWTNYPTCLYRTRPMPTPVDGIVGGGHWAGGGMSERDKTEK